MVLWEIFSEFVHAVVRGDRSWWPFLILVALIVGGALALNAWS